MRFNHDPTLKNKSKSSYDYPICLITLWCQPTPLWRHAVSIGSCWVVIWMSLIMHEDVLIEKLVELFPLYPLTYLSVEMFW